MKAIVFLALLAAFYGYETVTSVAGVAQANETVTQIKATNNTELNALLQKADALKRGSANRAN